MSLPSAGQRAMTVCPVSAGPKRGSLKSVGKRQESATFLQRSFLNVAAQFFACCSAAFGQNGIRTAEKPMLQCNFCSAAFRKPQRNFRFFACGMFREGANREKLTVKKLIDNEMFFFHRLCPLTNREKSA